MPPAPGEERLLTVFADIHSYFSEPTPKPTHHRFDKGSYLYVYHDANQQRSRIEVANNAGTADQDAFHGVLSRIHLCHSTRFPSLCTLTVDGFNPNPPSYPPPPGPEHGYEWHLPSNNPYSEKSDLLRLHTLDIYFWTPEDAGDFLDLMERLLAQGQIETDRHDPEEEEQETNNNEQENENLSTVVRQLENVAVTDPAYQNGQTRNSRSDLVTTSHSTPDTYGGAVTAPVAAPAAISSFPPPPPAPATAPVATAPAQPTQQTAASPNPAQEQQFTPMPYNPAAPAAPEPIQHREKTPPPADGSEGTGLATAVAVDNGVPFAAQQAQQQAVTSSFAPPPTQATHQFQAQQPQIQAQQVPYAVPGGGYASPPPSAGLPPVNAAGLTHSAPGSQPSRPQSTNQSPGLMSTYGQAPVAPSPSSPFFPGGVGAPNAVQPQQLSRGGSISSYPPAPQTQPQLQPQQQQQPQHQDPHVAANLYLMQQQQLLQQQQQQQAYVYSPVQAQPNLHQAASSQGTPITTTFTTPAQQYSYSLNQQPRTLDMSDPHVQLLLQQQQQQQLQQQQQQQQQMLAAGQPPSAQRHGRLENGASRVEGKVNKFLQKLNKF